MKHEQPGTIDVAKSAAMVKAAIEAMHKVGGKTAGNGLWALSAFALLQHVIHSVLKGTPEHAVVNRAAFEERLLDLYNEVKTPQGTVQ